MWHVARMAGKKSTHSIPVRKRKGMGKVTVKVKLSL